VGLGGRPSRYKQTGPLSMPAACAAIALEVEAESGFIDFRVEAGNL
jgi:hypothetical protein